MRPLEQTRGWPATRVAAATVGPDGTVDTIGDPDAVFGLTSVTKLLTAMAVLVAHEEGTLDLDEPLTAGGASTADLLAHAGGMAPDRPTDLVPVGTRRIYSTAAYDVVADAVALRSDMPFPRYLHEAVCIPLDMTATELVGSAGAGARGTVRDLVALARAWRSPQVVHRATLERATHPHRPDLAGVLPGFGHQDPNPWGLGPEIRGHKQPHWTGTANSEATFGHFGRSGTLLWVDPVADRTLIALTDEPFGPWAARAWPLLADAVLGTGPNDPSD